MRKKFRKLLVFVGLLAGILLLLSAGALASEPITGTMEIQPTSLTGPGSVRVVINVVNTGDDSTPISVTLYDPDGNVVTNFGSGGTANLAPSASQSYTGNWSVSQSQLDAGTITYSARYTITDESGQRIASAKPIRANITHNTAKAQLNIRRTIEPGSIVTQGQTVKIRYTIVNVGTIDVKNIVIKDPEIISEPATLSYLAVGETAEVSYQYTAGTTSKRTHAEFTFDYEINGKTETSPAKQVDPPTTIEVTVPDLIIQLAGRQIVNPGDKVDLTYVITNKSDLSYEQIKISDKLLGDVENNLSLGAGKSYQGTKSITVNSTATYQLTLTAVDSTGTNVIYLSNELTIQTTDTIESTVSTELIPINLSLLVEADRDIVYTEPSDINFRFQVTNNGAATVEKVAIGTSGHYAKSIYEIDRIEPGETKDFILQLSGSQGGMYQFTASATDSAKEKKEFLSNEVRVTYQAPAPTPTPTPPPTPEPEPEPSPTTMEPGWDDPSGGQTPTDEGGGLGSTLLYVFGGLLLLGVIAVVAALVLDSRRKGGNRPRGGGGGGGSATVKVIDTIQRSPHRDYMRAPKRAPTQPKNGKAPAQEDEDDIPQAYAVDENTGGYRPVQQAAPEQVYDEGDAAYDAAARYRRPQAGEQELSPQVPELAEEPEADVPQGDAPDGDTSVYSGEYLSRIRGAAKPAGDEFDRIIEEAAAKPSLSEEDAALLNGSTGQYRLSRRNATPPAPPARTSRRPIEDPEEFARKQRAAKAAKDDGSLSFYDDDEDEETTPRRRR